MKSWHPDGAPKNLSPRYRIIFPSQSGWPMEGAEGTLQLCPPSATLSSASKWNHTSLLPGVANMNQELSCWGSAGEALSGRRRNISANTCKRTWFCHRWQGTAVRSAYVQYQFEILKYFMRWDIVCKPHSNIMLYASLQWQYFLLWTWLVAC